MEEFTVTCCINEDVVKQKIQNSVVRYAKEWAKDLIDNVVREEVQKTLSKINIEEIVCKVYKERARDEVEAQLYRIRRNDYERFHWNGKEVPPSPEKMFNLITAYVSYIELMDDPEFKELVLDKAACNISDRITTSFGRNHGYKKMLETIKSEMTEKE